MKNLKTIARLTGIGYLLIFVTGFFGNFYVLEQLISPGDSTTTLINILNNPESYSAGVLAFLIMVITDLLLAWPLYTLLKDTNKKQALLSSLLRVLNAGFFLVALGSLFNISFMIHNNTLIATLVMQALEQFNLIWTIGLLIFGAHLILLGKLIVRSDAFPTIIGVLVILAGSGYLVDSTAQLAFSNYEDYGTLFDFIVIASGVIGELSLTAWLLLKGIKNKKTKPYELIL